jgi:small-conductance mechanosensitive channel
MEMRFGWRVVRGTAVTCRDRGPDEAGLSGIFIGSGEFRKVIMHSHPNTFLALALTILLTMSGTGFSQSVPSGDPSPSDLILFLNQTIDWYRQLDLQRQIAMEPDQALLFNDNQQVASETAWLAFEFARAEAGSIERSASPSLAGNQDTDSSRFQSLLKLSATLEGRDRETRAELESLRQKLVSATGNQRRALQSQIAETQSELDLLVARKDAVRTMLDFVGGSSTNGLGASGLREKIEALARSIPAALPKPSTKQEPTPSNYQQPMPVLAAGTRKPEPSGVWGLAADLLLLSRNIRTLADSIRSTDSLAQRNKALRSPLVDRLRGMSRRSDELAKQADSADQTELAQAKKEFDGLTAQFKQNSAAVLPLSKQGILLGVYKRNLTTWQSMIGSRYKAELRSLLFRILFLLVLLATITGAAELWRRAIFRLVHDVRRRYQFLLLRKIVFWCLIGIVLIFSFASELGSVATFAGLMTAGLAVALQNVILSIVGYFFLIGKFGIRVGDRVQVAGVTGEVVDIGLVRFHLLELVTGGGKAPSGRVVAFSNSIVFLSTAGLFKQIPGTNFVWHEITLTMPPGTDYGSADERLRKAVDAVFSEYREEMEQQHRQVERTLTATPVGVLRPRSRLRLTSSTLEAVIQYPVDISHSTDIDDRMTRELLKVIDQQAEIKSPGTGTPTLTLKTDVKAPD